MKCKREHSDKVTQWQQSIRDNPGHRAYKQVPLYIGLYPNQVIILSNATAAGLK